LPKPLNFNIYSLQYFPGYPLTQKALEEGHINEGDVTLDRLRERMASSWGFAPKVFPLTLRQILQNIIWLIVYQHTGDTVVKRAVFSGSRRSKLDLIYLNLKAIFWGKLHELKRRLNKKIA